MISYMRNLPVDKNAQDARHVVRVTWIGLAGNVFLSGLKFIAGFLGSSQAVVADAVHSLSDMGTDLAVLLGVKFWSAPPDEDHPYGHRRIETIITVAIGVALALAALGIGYNALATIRDIHLRQPGWIAIAGSAFAIVLKEVLYRWTVAVGRQVKSSAVIANAWHHRSDALSSVPVVIAVAIAVLNPKLAFIDHAGALVVSIFILKVSWDIISPSLSELADLGAPRKHRQKIRAIARGISGVKSVHAIRTRRLGSGLHVDLHILVDGEMTVRMGHEISRAVKSALIEKGPEILDAVVHLEPYE
ncbi:MAG: cation transporter [Deltaproteobacteria bacterium]|nr:MAG: cation transporter [Deltaproteobacteria bacterium]